MSIYSHFSGIRLRNESLSTMNVTSELVQCKRVVHAKYTVQSYPAISACSIPACSASV